jgi:tRNA (guanine37-N1)-methyltransferase
VRIDIITIFPEYFAPLGVSLIGKAAARGDIEFHVHDLRRWAHDVHRTVDDAPFGGGPGMVMKPEVWAEALDELAPPGGPGPVPRLVVPTPSGVPFSQAGAASYAGTPRLVFACGRYEGIDARFIEEARARMPVDEVSIGDYVLAGGEAAVLVMIEAVCRLLPGVLGNERSASDDSFGGIGSADEARRAGMAGLLEGPVYTRPRSWRGREVPDVLLSGDHAAIERWRRDAALLRTAASRPDLIERAAGNPAGGLDARDRQVLAEAAGRAAAARAADDEGAGRAAAGPSPAGDGDAGPAGDGPPPPGEAARLPGRPENMAH